MVFPSRYYRDGLYRRRPPSTLQYAHERQAAPPEALTCNHRPRCGRTETDGQIANAGHAPRDALQTRPRGEMRRAKRRRVGISRMPQHECREASFAVRNADTR